MRLEPDLSLQKPLEDYVEFIDRLNTRSIPLLPNFVSPLFSFQDPYHHVKGVSEACDVLMRRFDLYPDARYRVSDFVWGRREATAYLFWSLRFKTWKGLMVKRNSEDTILEGMSELKFTPEGEVYSHSDFWGVHDRFNVRAYKRDFS